MSKTDKKEFEVNKAKFHENNRIDPRDGSSVVPGNSKKYQELVSLYGKPSIKPAAKKATEDKPKTKKNSKEEVSEDKPNKNTKEDEVVEKKSKKNSKEEVSKDKPKKNTKEDNEEVSEKKSKDSKKDKEVKDKDFEINKAKFYEDNTIDPRNGKKVKPGNFKPYQALVELYGVPPEKNTKANTKKNTKKDEKSVEKAPKDETKKTKKEKSAEESSKDKTKKVEKSDASNHDDYNDDNKSEEKSNKSEEDKSEEKEISQKSTKTKKNVESNDKKTKKDVVDNADVSVDPTEKLVIKNKDTLLDDNKSWVMKFKDEGLPIIGSDKKKFDEWQAEYEKMSELKEEAMKLIKVNLATAEGINCTSKFNYNKTHLPFFPKHIRPKNEGEVHIHTEINNKALLTNKWYVTFYETFTPEDSTVDNTSVALVDVLYIIISVLHYNTTHSNDIQITNDKDLTLNRKYINQPKNKNIHPLYIAYKALDM